MALSVPSLDEIGEYLQQAAVTEAGADEAPPHDVVKVKVVPGFARRLVRKPRLPVIPPRRSSAEKEVYRFYLENKQALYDASEQNDCGCALYDFGCFTHLVSRLQARKQIECLIRSRQIRFDIGFGTLAERKRVELIDVCRDGETTRKHWSRRLHLPMTVTS